jgi:hypothetical protein
MPLKISCSVAEFYSSADNLVGFIYENFRAIGFEQISGHLILTIWNKTQKNFFSRNLQASSEAGKFGLRMTITANVFWLPAKKLNMQAWMIQCIFRNAITTVM